MNTTTQQGKLTDEVVTQLAAKHARHIGALVGFDYKAFAEEIARAIEAEVEARTAKKMEALVKDAARYRWLRDNRHLDAWWSVDGPEDQRANIDADIDADIAAHQQDTVAEKGEK